MKITKNELRKLIEKNLVKEVAPLALIPAAGAGLATIAAEGGVAAGLLAFQVVVGVTIGSLIGTAAWWMFKSDEEQEEIAKKVMDEGLESAFAIYAALKGTGTDEDKIKPILDSEDSLALQVDYAKVLKIVDDLEEGGLLEWLRADGMEAEAQELLVKMAN
jgi:hypothetical protein